MIGLGTAGLYAAADPQVLSRAIELYLESSAREAATQLPPGDNRYNALADAVERLRQIGVITPTLGVADPDDLDRDTAPRVRDSYAVRLVAELGTDTRPSDAANLDADRVVYGAHDRPRATGALPHTSAGGYPSAMAKAADPTDALGPDTRSMVYAEQSVDYRGRVVASAIPAALDRRRRAGS